VFAEIPSFERLWREEIRLAPEDVGVDVASRVLVCAAYRLRPVRARESDSVVAG
jgi:hypothetical protein